MVTSTARQQYEEATCSPRVSCDTRAIKWQRVLISLIRRQN